MKIFTSDAELAAAIPNAVQEVVVKNGAFYIAIGMTAGAWEAMPTPSATLPASVPQWVKYSIPFTAVAAGEMSTQNHLRVLVTTTAPRTSILQAAIKPAANFAGPGADMIEVSLGFQDESGEREGAFIGAAVGFGDGAGIEDDPEYLTYASVPTNYTSMDLFPGNQPSANGAVPIYLYLALSGATTIEEYQALTAGAVDVWLLQAVLP